MSQENVEVVGVGIDVFQAGLERGEFGAAFDAGFLHADIEWIQAPEISVRTTELRFATVYGRENGSVVRTRNYLDPADALKAAGRRE